MSSLVERAIVLLSVELGHEKSVVSTLRKAKCVEEVHEVYGVYDIIVKVTARGHAQIDAVVRKEISCIREVKLSITLHISDAMSLSENHNLVLSEMF